MNSNRSDVSTINYYKRHPFFISTWNFKLTYVNPAMSYLSISMAVGI